MATMKLLLKESVKNVGRVGDLVEVSPGVRAELPAA